MNGRLRLLVLAAAIQLVGVLHLPLCNLDAEIRAFVGFGGSHSCF